MLPVTAHRVTTPARRSSLAVVARWAVAPLWVVAIYLTVIAAVAALPVRWRPRR